MLILTTKPYKDNQRGGVLVKTGTLLSYEDNDRAKELIDKKFAREIEITEIEKSTVDTSKEDAKKSNTVTYEDMKITELKKLLDKKSIEYDSKDNKQDLIKLLEG